MGSTSYRGQELAKMVVLPAKGTPVRTFERHLMESDFGSWDIFKMLKIRMIARLEIPKHEVEGSYDLKRPLTEMGIDRMFNPETAD